MKAQRTIFFLGVCYVAMIYTGFPTFYYYDGQFYKIGPNNFLWNDMQKIRRLE